ncbi:lipopolysaccharide O-acetyltransferase [Duganella sp. 3397]|uniref:acyltransferase n=1 Tax=Duganella sp. 3397 TaxID=2817732 RepID=UPI00285B3F4A|nr:acyltransferase [Duganella sp. 3397]MDR7052275.1 lipopolysaccharide O-acetyltransferase [Duganella sp. 3397]
MAVIGILSLIFAKSSIDAAKFLILDGLHMKSIDYLFRVIRKEGLIHGMFSIAKRVRLKLKSIFFSYIFGAPKISFGSGCQFFGVKHISFGSEISIHRNIWLEAVTEYRGEAYAPCIIIGNRVKMSNNVHVTSINNITICDDVLLGSNVYISDHNHGGYSGTIQSHPSERPAERALVSGGPVFIEQNVWVGDNVNIVGPVRIGAGAVIAANSVIRKDVPPGVIVGGIPAKIIKIFDSNLKEWTSLKPNNEPVKRI